ncbi:MAG: hypothetical protein HY726_09735 [Candidatus Rokubacteria bacterium]|nr:hypothetical protein [Candidatus Rokubacteria bacterium]
MGAETAFTVQARAFEPAYLKLGVDAIERRAAEAIASLASCRVCPRDCEVDRLHDKTATCRSGRLALVGSHFPHFGEEDCLRGWNGSGTIFFSWCNLRCVFCLHPEEAVLTDRGPQSIETIFLSSGQEAALNGGKVRFPQWVQVYTRRGTLARAAKVFCHPYRGELVVVKPYGLPPLTVTPEHSIFVASGPQLEIEKIPAKALTNAHFMVVPKLRAADSPAELDVLTLLQPSVTSFRRSVRRRVSMKTLNQVAAMAAAGALTSRQIGEQLGYHPAYVRALLPRVRRGELQEEAESIRNDLVKEGDRIRYKETPEAYSVPIHRISRIPYEGPVYNLEVADADHSYIAQGVAVGNCQNWDISQKGEGEAVTPERLAGMMLELQARGCHNINFVTPEHVVPQILEALPLAIRGGLRLPIVYNTSAYDSLESLRWMDGIVDIYMPDFKVWDGAVAKRFLKAPDYPEAARRAISEMHRQVGPLVLDQDGMARRGLLVRHLVMPGLLEETRQIMSWLARELSPDTYVNVMGQYYPAGAVSSEKYPELNRRLFPDEYLEAVRIAREAGLWRLDERRPRRRPLWG